MNRAGYSGGGVNYQSQNAVPLVITGCYFTGNSAVRRTKAVSILTWAKSLGGAFATLDNPNSVSVVASYFAGKWAIRCALIKLQGTLPLMGEPLSLIRPPLPPTQIVHLIITKLDLVMVDILHLQIAHRWIWMRSLPLSIVQVVNSTFMVSVQSGVDEHLRFFREGVQLWVVPSQIFWQPHGSSWRIIYLSKM